MNSSLVRVGFDLDGSLESLGNSMIDLADALDATEECSLVRFGTRTAHRSSNVVRLPGRWLWSPLWRRGMGPPIDAMLPELDVVHVAGLATPPTKRVPLIVSVDDLRPLRGESRTHLRLAQLRRVVERGAIIVASSCSASHEVQSVLGVPRSQVVVVPPAVPNVEPTRGGTDLVVNVTGLAELFLLVAPALVLFARSRSTRVVALTSHEVGQQIHAAGMAVTVQPRHEARRALANARVVMHLSDGARFPSFAIAALSAGVPTIARSTEINRELLGGAAQLVGTYAEVPETLDELWESESRRAIMIAAGRSRAVDFAPSTAARAYASLYREAVRGWTP